MSKGLSKSQLLALLAEKSGRSKKEIVDFMDMLAETVYNECKSNGEFTFPGLGKMVKKDRAARQGRNPATGETIQIPAKTVLKFRVAKAAKDAIL
ncbi:HU family DNA-binding protein [Patescibacteria group bacterium]|nr:HU family DNA-binding protein [Patescibacteria group bacterium]MBU1890680.1 HU family DNA-binding protein [Patescibacteria group bacterium]